MLVSSILLTIYKFLVSTLTTACAPQFSTVLNTTPPRSQNRRKETEKGVLMMGFALYITVPMGLAAALTFYLTLSSDKRASLVT